MVFAASHTGIDAHVVSAHGGMFAGVTKQEKYADFKAQYPRPWPFAEAGFDARPEPAQSQPPRETVNRTAQREEADANLLTASAAHANWIPAQDETVIGVDFAGPREAGEQRKKILAVQARRIGPGRYEVHADGFNARLVGDGPPGWTAPELASALVGEHRSRLVAMDFPFSIPLELIANPAFAQCVGRQEPFGDWQAFNAFVAEHLVLACPTDLSAFEGWRDKAFWRLRATDKPAGAQPALKHKFQVLFNMALLGNALLGRLAGSGYRIEPFAPDTGQAGTVIEIYPGVTMRRLGRPDYKRDPAGAIGAMLKFCRDRGVEIDVDPGVRLRCETYGMNRSTPDPDASDALIALCTGILYREGLCQRVLDRADDARVAVEGAIWAPIT